MDYFSVAMQYFSITSLTVNVNEYQFFHWKIFKIDM